MLLDAQFSSPVQKRRAGGRNVGRFFPVVLRRRLAAAVPKSSSEAGQFAGPILWRRQDAECRA